MENLNNQTTAAEEKTETKTFTEEDVNKIKQGAEDRIRTEYSKKIKALEQELETFKPKKSNAEIELEERIRCKRIRIKNI